MWHGWYRLRPGQPWRLAVADARDIHEAHRLLLERTRHLRLRGTDRRLTRGGAPPEGPEGPSQD
jgi:hypothetical protein